MASGKNSFGSRSVLVSGGIRFGFHRLSELEKRGWSHIGRLPFSMKVLLENLLRREDGLLITSKDIESFLACSGPQHAQPAEVPFMPSRVLLQDFTGVPVVVDLSAMRDAAIRSGKDPSGINPVIPTDLVIDHSVQADFFGSPEALGRNESKEYERNAERYSLLRWAQRSFRNFTVTPPGKGIVHQVNLERLASVVRTQKEDGGFIAYPDTVVGTDSHTTMVNALGVLGWGVGGIEAEAVMLGQPYYLPTPGTVGVALTGELDPSATATDLVLFITRLLRERKVVGKFVEFFGPGLSALSVPDRATIANMAPEYGATAGFFPIDDRTLEYLRLTGREESRIRLVEAYAKEQGLFRSEGLEDLLFSETLEVDFGRIEPSIAGPKRPQDGIPLRNAARAFRESLSKSPSEWGFGLSETAKNADARVVIGSEEHELTHGVVVIAAITSCTNTSNPALMISAGLLAKKALSLGIRSKPWVKTTLTPGSRAVTDYLKKAGLLSALEAQGFYLAGYGCATCIGNSGPLPPPVQNAVERGDLVAAAVLSGNRNFEGRIHSAVRANYLAAPHLVVAYALAGRMTIDFETEPIGNDRAGKPVFLRDILPTREEVERLAQENVRSELFIESGKDLHSGGPLWQSLPVPDGGVFAWDAGSTYIRRPPFFDDLPPEPPPIADILGARALLLLGDSVTTDHISPAGAIAQNSPAGMYLLSQGVSVADFNSYGSRRGNHEVMARGTFANIRLRNLLLDGVQGGFTRHFPSGEQMTVWDAAQKYRQEKTPLIILAGKEYGTGSSRDWAAKGTALLGVMAVIAGSFERIHRSNLVGMGVLPLQFPEGVSAVSLGLNGDELFFLKDLHENLKSPARELEVQAVRPDGSRLVFSAGSRLDTRIEIDYYRHGGILPKILRELSR